MDRENVCESLNKEKILLWGKPPPAPVRRRGGFWGRDILSLPLCLAGARWWSSLNSGPTSNPGLPPSTSLPKRPLLTHIVPRTASVWKCQYVWKIEQDQRPFPGVITAVILAAVSVNKEKYSAALGHLIARLQDVACMGFLF